MEVGDNLSEKGKKDLLIVNRAKEGDQAAFAELLKRYRESVYFMLLKMIKNPTDADDLTIEAFGKAFHRIQQYSPNYAFSTWLFKIATNNCIDFIRKKRIAVTSMDNTFTDNSGNEMGMQIEGHEPTPEKVFIKKQKVKAMRDVVERLKPRYKELIIKRYFEELTYDEIAEELDLPLGTVKAQLFRAREFLATLMENTKDTI